MSKNRVQCYRFNRRFKFAENILTCGYTDGRLDELKAGKRIEINCDLLEIPENE